MRWYDGNHQAAIARTHSGECVGWISCCVEQGLDPDSAEAMAALLAMDF